MSVLKLTDHNKKLLDKYDRENAKKDGSSTLGRIRTPSQSSSEGSSVISRVEEAYKTIPHKDPTKFGRGGRKLFSKHYTCDYNLSAGAIMGLSSGLGAGTGAGIAHAISRSLQNGLPPGPARLIGALIGGVIGAVTSASVLMTRD